MKHRIFPLIALIGLGFLATGCSLGGSSNGTTNSNPMVRIWRNQEIDPIRSTLKTFLKNNKGVDISYFYKKETGLDYESTTFRSLVSNSGPDIWSLPSEWVGDDAASLQPLPENYYWAADAKSGASPVDTVKALYPSGISDQLIRSNQVIGVPGPVDTLRLYYNNDLFNSALSEFRKTNKDSSQYNEVKTLLNGPPSTWNQLVDQAKYLNIKDGNTITRSAIAFGTANNVDNASEIVQLLILQNGGKIISDDRLSVMFQVPITLNTGSVQKPGESALDFYTSFANPAKSNYSWNASMPSALDAFATGKVAMVIAFSDFEKQLAVKYPKFRPSKTTVPQITSDSSLTPTNLIKFNIESVTKAANNSNAAFNVLNNYTRSEIMGSIASANGLTTPYKKALESKNDAISNAVLSGTAVYKVKHAQFDNIFKQMIVDVSQNNIPSSSAIASAADSITELLKPPVSDQQSISTK